jgi:hypothetical protein
VSTTFPLSLDYKTAEFEVSGARPMRFRLGQSASVALWLDELDAHAAFLIIPSGRPATLEEPQEPASALHWMLGMLKNTQLQWELARAHMSHQRQVMHGVCVFDVPFALVDEWLMWMDQDAAVQATGSGNVVLRSHPAIRSRHDLD